MKVILIDDEKAMHLIMKKMLAKIREVEVMGAFLDTKAASSYLDDHEVNLIFVDINMPRESGLEFAEGLRKQGKQTHIVFITSHIEYALSAFDVFAFDYMVKPVKQDRLLQTVHRALAESRSKLPEEEVVATIEAQAVEFNALGRIEIHSDHGTKTKWKSSKSIELFAYLLVQQGRLVSRTRLIEDIFGNMPQKNAEVYLNTTVYQLRKLLNGYGLKKVLHTYNNYYALNLSDITVDFIRFEEGCRRLSVIQSGADIEQALLIEQMYVGDLFGEYGYTWSLSEVERLLLMYNALNQRLCNALLEAKDTSNAIRLLKKLLHRNELHEESLILLIRALSMQNNKEALIKHYEQYTARLLQEIGVAPSPELAALYAQLLSETQ
ncbi:response regulator [Paenibacillus xylanexedens]|uniref:Two-component SAPR family response regulator n=1 Tax=Paenibacillus xylanexedens TaxID=528191 RepID=A0ABS4S1B2_PAEXY|nr:response regulator [Paenibacillus xylanexedens]MBP2248919.1 two-component SAPR family response regulator [Paenibacillus xylanexedens]